MKRSPARVGVRVRQTRSIVLKMEFMEASLSVAETNEYKAKITEHLKEIAEKEVTSVIQTQLRQEIKNHLWLQEERFQEAMGDRSGRGFVKGSFNEKRAEKLSVPEYYGKIQLCTLC